MGNAALGCGAQDPLQSSEAARQLDAAFGSGTAEVLLQLTTLLHSPPVCAAIGSRANEWDKTGLGHEVSFAGYSFAGAAHPTLVNLGMILKQTLQEMRYATPLSSGTYFLDQKVLQKAERYSKYACAAYLPDKHSAVNHIGDIQADDIRHFFADSSNKAPGFFLAIDPLDDEIIVSVRGVSAREALNLAISPKERFFNGWVHSNLLQKAELLVERSKDLLVRLLQEFPRKRITFVGHGIGAGVAILTMILFSKDNSPFARLMAADKVKCYSFGSPPLFEPLWALPPWVQASTYCFVHGFDCVPRACAATLGKLYLAVKQADAIAMPTEERIKFIGGNIRLPVNLPDFVDLPQDALDKKSPASGASLMNVGTVILVYRMQDGHYVSEVVPSQMTDRVLMHPNMLKDHAAAAYQTAFEELLQSGRGCIIA